jgi:hypothetical protein
VEGVYFPDTLTDEVPKVPKGCSGGLLSLLALPHIRTLSHTRRASV